MMTSTKPAKSHPAKKAAATAPKSIPTPVPAYKIEDKVEIPPRSANRKSQFPFDVMQVGQSFEAPMDKVNALTTSASSFGLKHGQKFTVRRIDDKTLRCWRTA
jgi:hypothetical protein